MKKIEILVFSLFLSLSSTAQDPFNNFIIEPPRSVIGGFIERSNDFRAFKYKEPSVKRISYLGNTDFEKLKKSRNSVFLINGIYFKSLDFFEPSAINEVFLLENKDFPILKSKYPDKTAYLIRLTQKGEQCFFRTDTNILATTLDSINIKKECNAQSIAKDSSLFVIDSLPTLIANKFNYLAITNTNVSWDNIKISAINANIVGNNGIFSITPHSNCIVTLFIEKWLPNDKWEKTNYYFYAK